MPAPAARSGTNAITANTKWILVLERFHRRIPTVGHVRVGGTRAIGNGGSAHTAGYGFVISELLAAEAIASAESDVIHCSRTGGWDESGSRFGERAQHDIRDALRRFDVPGGHRGRRLSAHHGPAGRNDSQR